MFKLKTEDATIKNVNIRKEAAGENEGAVLAADVKIFLEQCPAELLDALAPHDTKEQGLPVSLFTDSGTPRFFSFSAIEFDAKFENHDVKIAGKLYEHCRIKGFKVTKLYDSAKIDLVFTIQAHPTKAQISELADKIKEEVSVTIEGKPELDLGGTQAEKKADKPKAEKKVSKKKKTPAK